MKYLNSGEESIGKTVKDFKQLFGGNCIIEFTDNTSIYLKSEEIISIHKDPSPWRRFKAGHLTREEYERILEQAREEREKENQEQELKELRRLKAKYDFF